MIILQCRPPIHHFELCFALQFETDAAFDQFRAKAAFGQRRRSAGRRSPAMSAPGARGWSPAMLQATSTRPPGTDRAPYFAALVDSSCMTMVINSAACGFSMIGGPLDADAVAASYAAPARPGPLRAAAPRSSRLGTAVMGVAQGMEAGDQIGFGLAVRQGPLGDRRDHGERVLDAMAELGRQHLLLLLGGNDAGDVDKGQRPRRRWRRRAVDRGEAREIMASPPARLTARSIASPPPNTAAHVALRAPDRQSG